MSEDLKQLAKEVQEDALKKVEELAVILAEKHLPKALDIAAAEIPGKIDDAVIAALKPSLVKAAIELAKGIHKEVQPAA